MNRYQAAFVASFLLTFSFLVLVARFINNKLVAAGYHISHIILIGLPNNTITMADTKSAQDALVTAVKNFTVTDLRKLQLPFVGSVDLLAFLSSPIVLLTTALILGTAVYVKLFRTKTRPKPLDPTIWKEFPLEKKIQVSPNTAMYRFTLPHPDDVLGLPIGQHISVSAEINGKVIIRNYTPISHESDRGFFELMIKSYEKGNVSKHIALLKIGDKLRVKGPKGQFHYSPGLVEHLSMLAGGSGITPMLQIIRAILRNPSDTTTVSLIYANVNEEDILLRNDIEQLSDAYKGRFKVFFVLNNPPPGWQGGVGFVTKEHIKDNLPNPGTTNSKLLICGPTPMVTAMKKNLSDLGYPAPNIISKLVDQVFVF